MARFEVQMPHDLEDQLSKLSLDTFSEIAPKMIEAAYPVLVGSVKKNLAKHRRGGDLEKSVTGTKPQYKGGAVIGGVQFKGYDSKTKVANAQKAMSLEYGTRKQDPTPFLDKSVNDVHDKVVEIMQEVFYTEVGSR